MNNDIWDQIILDTDPYQIKQDSVTTIVDLGRAMEAFSIATEDAIITTQKLTDTLRNLYNDLHDLYGDYYSHSSQLSYLHLVLGAVLLLMTLVIAA